MTVKELIERLQKESPEAEVITNSGPIYVVEGKPGYYDGHTPVLIQDDKKKPYFSIVGYKWDPSKDKILLHSMNLEDCLYNCNDSSEVDSFKIEGSERYLEGALELKETVKRNFKEWGKS